MYIDRMRKASMLTCSGSITHVATSTIAVVSHPAQSADDARREAVYRRRAKDTAAAVAYSTSLATLKATWRMLRERKAIAAKRSQLSDENAHVEQRMASADIPASKGVKRYRAVSAMSRQATVTPRAHKRVVPEHVSGMGVTSTVTTVMGMPIGALDLPVCGNTVIGVHVNQPAAGTRIAIASTVQCEVTTQHPADVQQPGHPDYPIEIDDSDATTLADSEQTDTDSDLTESDSEDSVHKAVVKAQRILETWYARHPQHGTTTEWDAASVMDLKMPLLVLARTLDVDLARQQVAARFITESQVSWEARGAAMLGEYDDYASAMAARLQGISRDAAEWRGFGDTYMRVLALLQLDTRELHGIWPCTIGGEASFRSMWRYKIKQWSSMARRRSESSSTSDRQIASRGDTVKEVQMYWRSLHDAMHAQQPPSVVMAVAEAALRATAAYWDFGETIAMEAVMSKVEERLPLTFGSSQMVAFGTLITTLSKDATNAI